MTKQFLFPILLVALLTFDLSKANPLSKVDEEDVDEVDERSELDLDEYEVNLDDNEDKPSKGQFLRVLGESGKISFRDALGTELHVQLKSIYELDAAGNFISNELEGSDEEEEPAPVKENETKHHVRKFKTRSFTVSAVTQEEVLGLPANVLSLETTPEDMLENTIIRLKCIVFAQAGTITLGDAVNGPAETFDVAVGSMKFNFEVENWPFCTESFTSGCGVAQIGTHLEAAFRLSYGSKENERELEDDDVEVDERDKPEKPDDKDGEEVLTDVQIVVDTSRLIMSALQYRDDTTWSALPLVPGFTPDGFDAKDVLRIRFDAFSTSLHYDPIVNLNSSSSALSGLVAVAIALVSMVKLF